MTQDAPYSIEQFNIITGETTRRTITPLPTPQRLQPAKQITKPELIEMLDTLRDDMTTEQEKFDRRDEIDAAAKAKRHELSWKVSELTRQLHEAQAELDQLNREGSVRDRFIAFVKQTEQRILTIATGTYNFLLEKFSQDRHEAGFKELTPLLKEDVEFRVDRSGIGGLTQPSFVRLYSVPNDHITDARIETTLNKVYDASEKLEKVLNK
jgi:predicted RNase H-like nuclease (RuvC/YqgF family)